MLVVRFRLVLVSLLCWGLVACAHSSSQSVKRTSNPVPKPDWMTQWTYSAEKVCGVGIAGPGFPGSPYPEEQARHRAVRNLAGSIETAIQEAIIATQRESGSHVTLRRHFEIDADLLQDVSNRAVMDYWVDVEGEGPFLGAGFTYARACIDASTGLADPELDKIVGRVLSAQKAVKPTQRPDWLNYEGTQPGGRLCAIGFSKPAFYPEQTFGNVVEDVRAQLAKVITTLVSEYQVDVEGAVQWNEIMTVASSQGVAEGVVVTHYWFDADGVGPMSEKGTTYGWGCVYPNRVIQGAIDSAQSILPEHEKSVVDAVRNRAASAFDELQKAEANQPK